MILIYTSHIFEYLLGPRLGELEAMALLEEVYHWEAGFKDCKDM